MALASIPADASTLQLSFGLKENLGSGKLLGGRSFRSRPKRFVEERERKKEEKKERREETEDQRK